MRKLLLATVALFASVAIVKADFVLNPTQVGQSGVVNYNGVVEGNVQAGLSASITFTLSSVDLLNNIWNFGFDVSNTSSLPITGSRVSTFGFNTDPNFSSASITGGTVFTDVSSGNVPQHTVVEFCATAGPNCAGGGGGGVAQGGNAIGSFSLDFDGSATLLTTISFTDLYVRYQSIVGSTFGNSATGFPTETPTPFCTTPPCTFAVPGPLVGAGAPGIAAALGLLGFNYWRRRRRYA